MATNSKIITMHIIRNFHIRKKQITGFFIPTRRNSAYHYFLEYKNKNQIVKLFQKSPTDTLKGVIINWIYQHSNNETKPILYSLQIYLMQRLYR